MADKPTHRLITKNEGETKWTEIAAAWENAKGLTITFSKPVAAGSRALLVKNESPKKAANG
jgi:hypothetical protein